MPTAQGILSGKKITVMRDSGCTSAVVRCSLVKETEMTGKHQSCVMIDGTIRKFPLAKVQVSSPYYSGKVEALCRNASV